ncbi:MAG: hypothetical protein KDB86_12935 [Actinobacteria bacterium]|nr:hypothetical protein [Actinomycetota bacterium]MCB9389514.1 hypothetical protein [Acidimicrobiia bacterium]
MLTLIAFIALVISEGINFINGGIINNGVTLAGDAMTTLSALINGTVGGLGTFATTGLDAVRVLINQIVNNLPTWGF